MSAIKQVPDPQGPNPSDAPVDSAPGAHSPHPVTPANAADTSHKTAAHPVPEHTDAFGAGLARLPFQIRINRQPCILANRLWIKDRLDPEEEKLRCSN